MAFLAPILDLLRLRSGPQDMPGDRTTLTLAVALYMIAGIAQLVVLESLVEALALVLLTTILLAIYTAALLLWRGTPNRFRQTATALFFCGTVFTLIMIGPDMAMAPYLHALRNQAEQGASTPTQTASQSPQKPRSKAQNAARRNTRSGTAQSSQANAGQSGMPALSGWAFILFMVIGLWRLFVFSHIYQQALDTTRWLGLATAVGFELFLFVVFTIL